MISGYLCKKKRYSQDVEHSVLTANGIKVKKPLNVQDVPMSRGNPSGESVNSTPAYRKRE